MFGTEGSHEISKNAMVAYYGQLRTFQILRAGVIYKPRLAMRMHVDSLNVQVVGVVLDIFHDAAVTVARVATSTHRPPLQRAR